MLMSGGVVCMQPTLSRMDDTTFKAFKRAGTRPVAIGATAKRAPWLLQLHTTLKITEIVKTLNLLSASISGCTYESQCTVIANTCGNTQNEDFVWLSAYSCMFLIRYMFILVVVFR